MQQTFKYISFLFILSLNTFTSLSQSKISGKIIDSDTNTPLGSTQITNIKTGININATLNGTFQNLETGTYTFQKEGYLKKTIELKKGQYYIIQLSINPYELNEIIINSNQIPKKLKKATNAINIISSDDIARYNNTDFAPILNRTPGVFMQSGALNTNRITIRGIGSRNLYGTSKIRAYFKDIPLTNGSGETTIEDFELASISQLEIIKGAASSVYGAGLGGVIHLKPQNAFLNESSFNSELTVGSFGLIKSVINANYGTSKNSFRAVFSDTESDGYRENNNYNRQTITLNTNHFISKKDEVSFLASFVDLKAFIPSSINENTYLNNPESAAFTWKQAQGYEDASRGIFGVSWNHDYSSSLKQVTSVFTSFRDAYEPRPFDILKENTRALGIRSRVLGNELLFKNPFNWTIGAELFNDTYTYGTFENLYKDFPPNTGSVEGNQLSNYKERRYYYNVFAEADYEISKKTTISIGLNINKTSYNLKDRFPVSTENQDQSGSYNYKDIVSPKFGVSHLLNKQISVFSSVSHGFSPISLQETLLPDGQINTAMKPETGWNYEIGTRGAFLNDRFQFNASIYRLDVKNLLVPRRTAEDQFIGVNAGKTQHDGLELAVNYKLLDQEKISISTFLNYTLNHYIFKDFIDDTKDFSGNELTGVPSDVFNAGLDFQTLFGFYGNINYQFVSSMPITDSNSLYSDNYNLINLKTGYQTNLTKKLKLNTFVGVNNVFNEFYASQILINASGFGGSAPRYYYPGNPVNYYAGINLGYLF